MSPSDPRPSTPEFSRPVQTNTLHSGGIEQKITATPAECGALARRFGLPALGRLDATVKLRRVRGEMVRVEGRFEAEITQTCVVSLEPFTSTVEDAFTGLFAPPHLVPTNLKEIDIDFGASDDDEEPEPMEGGRIDLGELVAQHVSLALDPYPRKPGEAFQDIVESDGEEDAPPATVSPFAKLDRLKRDA